MVARPVEALVLTHDHEELSALRDSRVLLYWPHGFGDWVQLAYLAPVLHRSNRYWITRFGDDNVALFDGHATVGHVYLGDNSTHGGDGERYGMRHFGLRYEDMDGSRRTLMLPDTLAAMCERERVDAVFWTSFPEPAGHVPPPFHSKPRSLLTSLPLAPHVEERLGRPLPTSIPLDVPPWIRAWVETRLRNRAGLGGRRLCVIGRNGYTSVGKNWGHLWREDLPPSRRFEGEECRDFMRLMLRDDPRWLFLVVEDRLFEGEHTVRDPELHAYSYAELFGTPDTSSLPFGLIMRAVFTFADLAVGVPAGPYHLAMALPGVPTVGVWIEHLPSWFDEPKEESVHVVSRNVRDLGLDRRPGSFEQWRGLSYRIAWEDTRIVTGEQVMSAVKALL